MPQETVTHLPHPLQARPRQAAPADGWTPEGVAAPDPVGTPYGRVFGGAIR